MTNREWVAWSKARQYINQKLEAAGHKPISRQFLTLRLVPLMEAAGDAPHGEKDTLVKAAALDRWAYYMVYRADKIESGEWNSIRTYSMEDVQEADEDRKAKAGRHPQQHEP